MEIGPVIRAMLRNKLRFGLIVAEVALTLAIVTNCVNMIMAARADLSRPSGFDDDNLVSVYSNPFDKAFEDRTYMVNQIRADLTALRAMPGIASATNSRLRPWQGGGSSSTLKPLGSKDEESRTQIYCADTMVTKTLGISLIAGRGFDDAEVYGDPNRKTQEVLVSKAYADIAFPKGDALGKTLEDGTGEQAYAIVGIVDPFYNPYAWEIGNNVTFFACPSGSFSAGTHYLIRAEPGKLAAVLPAIEARLLELNNGRNITLKPIADLKQEYQVGQMILVRSLNAIIVLLLFVTAVGIVGLTAFTVTERTRQIGTRRALGATKRDVLRYFMIENWVATTIGISLGLLGAYGLNIVLATAADAQPLGWGIPLMGTLLLWAIGMLGTLGPAMRATRIAPAIATRNV